MVVSDKHKYIFASTPKAGTHSMYHLLEKYFDGTRVPNPNQYHHTIHTRNIPVQYKDYFKFTIVSNPFRRAIACWKPLAFYEPYRIKRGWLKELGGEEFVYYTRYIKKMSKSQKTPPKKYMIWSQSKLHDFMEYDRVLNLQNLQEEFNELPFVKEEIQTENVFSANKKEKPHFYENEDDWKKEYNDECIQNVLEAWGNDFEKYGYSKEL